MLIKLCKWRPKTRLFHRPILTCLKCGDIYVYKTFIKEMLAFCCWNSWFLNLIFFEFHTLYFNHLFPSPPSKKVLSVLICFSLLIYNPYTLGIWSHAVVCGVHKKASDLLELELEVVVSHSMWVWRKRGPNSALQQEQYELSAESSLQPPIPPTSHSKYLCWSMLLNRDS